jgi:uncharacterized cupredoxin-like copper-binding protein
MPRSLPRPTPHVVAFLRSPDRRGVALMRLLALGAALSLACAQGDTGSNRENATPTLASGTVAASVTATNTNTIEVILQEWAVLPSAPSVKAGHYDFVVKDRGDEAHTLFVAKWDGAAEQLPTQGAVVQFGGPVTLLASTDEFTARDSARRLSLDLTPGNYVLLCNRPGHYQGGMRTAFAVR